MRFWDSSAIVPLLFEEARREELLKALDRDPVILAWWGTAVECVSAISRREREGALTLASARIATDRLKALGTEWNELLPSDTVRTTAQRLLRVHPLRAADSLQLAAAIVGAEGDPARLPFVCLDERLAEAATREGFVVVS